MAKHKSRELCLRGRLHQAAIDCNSGVGQRAQPAAVNLRIGIAKCHHNPGNAGCEQRIDAGRRASVMAAGLEGHVDRGTRGARASLTQGLDLGVIAACRLRITRANDLVAVGNYTAHVRIRSGPAAGSLSQAQRPRHVKMIASAEHGR